MNFAPTGLSVVLRPLTNVTARPWMSGCSCCKQIKKNSTWIQSCKIKAHLWDPKWICFSPLSVVSSTQQYSLQKPQSFWMASNCLMSLWILEKTFSSKNSRIGLIVCTCTDHRSTCTNAKNIIWTTKRKREGEAWANVKVGKDQILKQ